MRRSELPQKVKSPYPQIQFTYLDIEGWLIHLTQTFRVFEVKFPSDVYHLIFGLLDLGTIAKQMGD